MTKTIVSKNIDENKNIILIQIIPSHGVECLFQLNLTQYNIIYYIHYTQIVTDVLVHL